jgi:hypothetical protein
MAMAAISILGGCGWLNLKPGVPRQTIALMRSGTPSHQFGVDRNTQCRRSHQISPLQSIMTY